MYCVIVPFVLLGRTWHNWMKNVFFLQNSNMRGLEKWAHFVRETSSLFSAKSLRPTASNIHKIMYSYFTCTYIFKSLRTNEFQFFNLQRINTKKPVGRVKHNNLCYEMNKLVLICWKHIFIPRRKMQMITRIGDDI